jgi:LPS-assembly lipoprotein
VNSERDKAEVARTSPGTAQPENPAPAHPFTVHRSPLTALFTVHRSLFTRFHASLLLAITLAACGFQLKGDVALPFASVHVASMGASQVAARLKRDIAHSATRLAESAQKADAQLNIAQEKRERLILSLSGAGKVREYQLKLTVMYQVADNLGRVNIPSSEIQLQRILTYDDAQIIAKQQEEAQLFQDMEKDAASQILRRMTAIRR